MRSSVILSLAVVLLTAGCANVALKAGLTVLPPNSLEIARHEEPGHSLVVDASLINEDAKGIDVVVGSLPRPIPTRLMSELTDPARSFVFWMPKVGYRGANLNCDDPKLPQREVKCQGEVRVLQRVTSRAIIYRGETAVGIHRAVINPRATQTVTLMPFGQGKVYGTDINQLVISSDGKFGITTRGLMVDLEAVGDLRQLPSGFFQRYPSPATVVSRDINSDEGHGFIAGLRQMFPETLYFRDRPELRFRARPEAWEVWRRYASMEFWPARVLSCASYRATGNPLTTPLAPLKAGITLAQVVNAIWVQDDCLQPYPQGEMKEEIAP